MVRMEKLPEGIHERIQPLVDRIATMDDVVAFYLFGSAARNDLQPLSDIDFAVLLSDSLTRERIEELRFSLTGLITETLATEEFDLVILNTAPIRFSHAVFREGLLLFVKDKNQLVDFRERNTLRYLDFSYYRKEFNKVFLERVGYHG